MSHKEIHCCIECGRETTRSSKICNICMPTYHSVLAQKGNENYGRKSVSPDTFQSPIDLDDLNDDCRPLRNDLKPKVNENTYYYDANFHHKNR